MAKAWKIAGVIFGAIVFLAVGVYFFGGTLNQENTELQTR